MALLGASNVDACKRQAQVEADDEVLSFLSMLSAPIGSPRRGMGTPDGIVVAAH
jgi:hypothetical protein